MSDEFEKWLKVLGLASFSEFQGIDNYVIIFFFPKKTPSICYYDQSLRTMRAKHIYIYARTWPIYKIGQLLQNPS